MPTTDELEENPDLLSEARVWFIFYGTCNMSYYTIIFSMPHLVSQQGSEKNLRKKWQWMKNYPLRHTLTTMRMMRQCPFCQKWDVKSHNCQFLAWPVFDSTTCQVLIYTWFGGHRTASWTSLSCLRLENSITSRQGESPQRAGWDWPLHSSCPGRGGKHPFANWPFCQWLRPGFKIPFLNSTHTKIGRTPVPQGQ